MLATLLLLALLLPTSKVEGANGLFGGDSSLEDLGLTADCRSLVDERCFFGLGVPIHTGTPGEAQCEESCAVFPSMRSKKKCGSCQSEEQIKENTVVTYKPGRLNVEREGLLLSEGLTARILATSNQPVLYDTPAGEGSRSDQLFHIRPDMGATFPDPRTGNEGGWIYVSNSEFKPAKEETDRKQGGVGAITFDTNGNVVDYRMVMNGTEANCGGGRTPWGTWVSGEEHGTGELWQVDPTGERPAEVLTMGNASNGYAGFYESFAYDARDRSRPRFYATKDQEFGELRRFTPDNPSWEDPWMMLHGEGKIDYLVLKPNAGIFELGGTFEWVDDVEKGRISQGEYFPYAEGIDVAKDELFFISKVFKSMFILNLDNGTYQKYSTNHGLFDGQPDQVLRILDDDDDGMLYFTEDGGDYAGVHARNRKGQFFTVLESPSLYHESTGLSFSPNGLFMYFAFQESKILFEVKREDGLSFKANTLDVKYHNFAVPLG